MDNSSLQKERGLKIEEPVDFVDWLFINGKWYNSMKIAIEEARIAFDKNEVPIGVAIFEIKTGRILARSHNRMKQDDNPIAHAEMLAITSAVKNHGAAILRESAIYITVEPCQMCAGAISLSKIKRLYYGASRENGGAISSGFFLYKTNHLNHYPEIYSEIDEAEASQLMIDFFTQKR